MKVTVIIPAYNAASFLKEAVESALAQGDTVAEIIIVENNSTDNTLLEAHSLAELWHKVRVIEEYKQGCSAARNAGMSVAKTEWLQFLDADDLLHEGKLAAQLECLGAQTQWVIAGYEHLYPDGSKERCLPNQDPWKGLVHNFSVGNTCANLYRKSTLEALGAWPEELPDNTDHHLHFTLLKSGATYQLDQGVRMVYRHFNQDRVSIRQPLGRMERKVNFHAMVNDYLSLNRPAYWSSNSAYFRAAHVRALRMLATYDLDLAQEYYQRAYADGLPALDHQIISKFTLLYQYLGFKRTERIRRKLATLIPGKWKARLKRLLMSNSSS